MPKGWANIDDFCKFKKLDPTFAVLTKLLEVSKEKIDSGKETIPARVIRALLKTIDEHPENPKNIRKITSYLLPGASTELAEAKSVKISNNEREVDTDDDGGYTDFWNKYLKDDGDNDPDSEPDESDSDAPTIESDDDTLPKDAELDPPYSQLTPSTQLSPKQTTLDMSFGKQEKGKQQPLLSVSEAKKNKEKRPP